MRTSCDTTHGKKQENNTATKHARRATWGFPDTLPCRAIDARAGWWAELATTVRVQSFGTARAFDLGFIFWDFF
jgi:hypothetical protein